MERNNSHTMHDSLNVFDDEFAVDDFDFIGDGFAPGRVHNGGNDDDGDEEHEPAVRSVAAHMADMPISPASPISRMRANRSSIRKSRDADNPFRSVEDDGEDDDGQSVLGRTPSIRSQSTVAYAPGITHRSTSSTSSRPFAATQSSFQGGSGPSHPYAMYPQGTNLARTVSASTTSTIRPQRPLLDQQGPAHPYGMYPQNVSEDIDEPEDHNASSMQTHIPVGFPGRAQVYNRQQGPEGEEHDIIGVDGHTEQLPPYSEYPEDGAPKHIVLPAQTATITPPNGTQLTLPLMPGRPQSMSDAGARANPQAFASMEQMESNDSTASEPKHWSEKTWKEKRKTKFCGIPFWWILLSLCVLAFIAIVLGSAIGGFMGSQKKGPRRSDRKIPSSTSLYDASAIPTSSSGSPPPTGTYALTLSTPDGVQAECLSDQSYSQAWSCDMAGPQSLGISIEDPPSNSGGWTGACLLDACPDNGYNNISYGTQTPTTSFSQFIAVSDNDEPGRGPAFYFQAFYDKVVVVSPDAFASATAASSAPSSSSTATSNKRDERDEDEHNIPAAWHMRHQIAPSTQPWFCYWNGTFIEGFIYSTNQSQASSSASQTASSYAPPASTSSRSSFTTTSTILEVSGPSTTSTLRMASTNSAYAAMSSSAVVAARSMAARSYSGDYYGQLPEFDYVVKIEERRISGSPAPYCQKMQILDDGTAGFAPNPSSDGPITIQLGESDPPSSAYQSSSASSTSSSSKKNRRSDTVAGGCHCQWWSGA